MKIKHWNLPLVVVGLITIGLLISVLAITGCDETNMMKPVVPVDGTDPGEPTDPTTNGEVKQPEPTDPNEPTEPVEPEPTPEPTVAIGSAVQEDNGSVTVSGTSTDVPEGTTVTVTLGDTVTATTTTGSAGAWIVTVPAIEAETLTAGTVAITATAANAAGVETNVAAGSVEYAPSTTYGIPTPTEAERIQVEIVVAVLGEDTFWLPGFYKTVERHYGGLFDVATEQGRDLYQGFAEYEYKNSKLAENPPPIDEWLKLIDQYFEEAYGISADYARWLVYEVYIEEKPEDEHFLGTGWQTDSIAMEYLLLQVANPNATEEDLLELLRESIRAGKVTIVSQY